MTATAMLYLLTRFTPKKIDQISKLVFKSNSSYLPVSHFTSIFFNKLAIDLFLTNA